MINVGNNIYYNKIYKLKKSYFFKMLGVKEKSYIGRIISRIHDYYFKNEQLLKKEFKKYYSKEFGSFENYLDKKHNLFDEEIEKLDYKLAYYSEKQFAEKYAIDELIDDIHENNVLGEKVKSVLNIDGLGKELHYEN